MKKLINLIFLISMLSMSVFASIPCLEGSGPLLLGQSYCTNSGNSLFNFLSPDHYEINYASTFTHYFDIEQDENTPLNIAVNFGFDLNNPNPTLTADKYRIVEEYDFYNYIRPSTSKTVIENFDDYKISTEDNSELDNNDYDFIGVPMHLTSCYLDCDINDNTPAISFNLRNSRSTWFQNILETYDPNTAGLIPYNWLEARFELDRETIVPYTLRFDSVFNQCSYDTAGIKTVSIGCNIEADTFLRHPNIDSVFGFWDLTDMLPDSIPSGAQDKTSWTIQKRIDVDIDNKNFSVTVTTQDPTGGDYIPPTGEGILGQTMNDVNIEEQEAIYLLKETSEIENEWQKTLLTIIDVIFVLLMVIFYLISSFVLMFFFFGSLPYIFNKFNTNLEKLTTLKRRK